MLGRDAHPSLPQARGTTGLRGRLAALGHDVPRRLARRATRPGRPRRGEAAEGVDPASWCSSPRRKPREGSGARSRSCAGSVSPATSAASSRRPRRASCSPPRCAPTRLRRRSTSSGTAATSSAPSSSAAGSARERAGSDDAGVAYGAHARFWVEPERAEEFGSASEARRAAWAWRRYVTAARAVPERTLEIRYEQLVSEPKPVANRLAEYLDLDPEPLKSVALEGVRPLGRPLTEKT